jgi:predicted DsbA family dithiol-disulfide isomerase
VEFEWMPFELRPYPNETLRPEGEHLQRAWKERVLPLAERMGVPMRLPQASPQPHTHLAHEGLQFAKEHGRANEYNHAVMSAFFQNSEDIGDVEVLTRIAGRAGLNEQEFRRALEERRYREQHQRLLRDAYQSLGISAVPSFFIGRRRLQGLYPKEILEQVIEEELKRKS